MEWLALDSFPESVPEASVPAGLAFDTASPTASPPQAILLAPAPVPGTGGPSDEELRSLVCYARTLAHGRMCGADDLADAGLGPLASWAVLPQGGVSGVSLSPDAIGTHNPPMPDLPVVLAPERDDAEEVVTAVTGDPLWMLGAQWRLGEHAGADAATPLRIDTDVSYAAIGPAPARPGRDPRRVPVEACLEGDTEESERYDVRATRPAPSSGNWRTEELTYAARFPVDGGAFLDVADHRGGPAQWWAMTANRPTPEGSTKQSSRSRPGRLRWPGQPRRRHFQIEDPARDPAGSGPDRTQPATLHLIDVLAQHGQDIFVTELPGRAGHVLRPGPVTMTDAAGGRWQLRPPPDWSLIRVAGLDNPPPSPGEDRDWQRALPILLDTGAALQGPVLDDVAIAVDEDDNLVWAAELIVAGKPPPVRPELPSIAQADAADSPTAATAWSWDLGGRIPHSRFPFLHSLTDESGTSAHEDVFVRARVADPRDPSGSAPGPASVPLRETTRLRPLALPASGVRLLRRPVLARAVDGSPVLWLRRETRSLDAGVDVDLRWDTVTRGSE